MSFTLRDAQKATATGSTTLTITKPTGLTVGDLMVAVIGKDDDPAITGPGDWTEVRGGTGTITGNDHSWWLGYKVADAADVAASNFQWSGDSEDWSGTIAAFIPSNSNPVHVATSTAVLRENDATPISNAITAASAGSLLIGGAVAAQADTGGLGAQTSGYTVAASPAPTTGTGNGDNGSVLAYKLSATGGETTFEANNAESVAESHAFIMEFTDESTQYVTPGLVTQSATAFDPSFTYDQDITPPLAESLATAFGPTVAITGVPFGQIAARAYTDGDEAGAAIVAGTNSPTLKVGTLYHLRFEIEELESTSQNLTGQLERQLNSGSWADVNASSTVLKTMLSPSVYDDGEPTTNRLDTSAKTFVAGTVDMVDGLCANVALNNQVTNLVYTVYIPAGDVTHGDTINVRVRNTHADGDPTYTEILSATVAETLTLPGTVAPGEGHTSIETPGYWGPYADTNGNLYCFAEPGLQTALVEADLTAFKSENGGKSWRPVAVYKNTTMRDLESFDLPRTAAVTTGELWCFKNSGSGGDVDYVPFYMSDHASTPDTFGTVASLPGAASANEYTVAVVERSDGDLLTAYGQTISSFQRIAYDWHNGTSWAGEAYADQGTASTHYVNPRVSLGGSDRTVVVYADLTNNDIYMQAINAAGSKIGSAQKLNTLSAFSNADCDLVLVGVVCYDDTNDYHVAIWASADQTLYSNTIKWGGSSYTVGSETQVSTTTVDYDYPSANDMEGLVAAIAGDPDNGYVYVFYARASDSDIYYNFWSESGGWDTETSLLVSPGNQQKPGYITAHVFTHSAANGSARVVGYTYDLFDSTTDGDTIDDFLDWEYNEVTAEAGSLSITPALVAQTLAQAYAPTLATGEVFVTPPLAQSLAQAHDPTITTGEVFVTPPLAQTLAQAFDPTLATGEVFVTPPLAQQLAQAYAPTVTLGSPVISQTSFRFRDGTRSTLNSTVWGVALDTDWDVSVTDSEFTFGFRVVIANSGDAPMPSTSDFRLEVRVNDGAWNVIGAGQPVYPSIVNWSTGDATTQLLGSGSFDAGQGVEHPDTDVSDQALGIGKETELEWALELGPSQLSDGDWIELAVVYREDVEAWQYAIDAVAPTINISKPIRPVLKTQFAQAFDPTIATGEVFITPGLAQSLATAFDPSFATGEVFVTPSLAQSLTVAYNPVVSLVGGDEQFATPDLAQSLAQAHDPTITTGEAFITPAVAQSLAQAFAPTFTTGEVFVTPDLAQSLAQAHDPTVTTEAWITPALVAQTLAQAHDPTVTTGEVFITPALVDQTIVAYAPTVTLDTLNITPGLVTQPVTAYAPTVTREWLDTGTVELLLDSGSALTDSMADVSLRIRTGISSLDLDIRIYWQILEGTTVRGSGDFPLDTGVNEQNISGAGWDQITSWSDVRIKLWAKDTTNGSTADVRVYDIALLVPGGPQFAPQYVTPELVTQNITAFDPSFSIGIAPGLVTQTITPFDPTVVPGTLTISPPLTSQLVTAFAPAVWLYDQFVTPELVTQNVTAYSPTVLIAFDEWSSPLYATVNDTGISYAEITDSNITAAQISDDGTSDADVSDDGRSTVEVRVIR